ncbi:MAG: hypothetical protein QGH74_02210, partial [Candidatus Brocadiia bacterium]|nr:hypothetical protein [Candidatus Brocadiia bacterium]
SQTGAFATGDIAKVAAKGVLILGALFFGAFCFPMVVMLLGAAQGGSSPILKALNPLNVFKAIFKAPAQYLGLWVFYAVNIILTPVVVVLVLVSITVALGPRWARLLNLAGFFGALVYMAGVVGWRMGMFLHRHPKVFDHVR